jgi:hypothetical protein
MTAVRLSTRIAQEASKAPLSNQVNSSVVR